MADIRYTGSRRAWDTGLCDMLAHTGRSRMTVIEIGSFAGESSRIFLETGVVDKLYCVDTWTPGYDSDDEASALVDEAERAFDRQFAGDSRVVKIKNDIRGAISDGVLPDHVDMVYIDANHTYRNVASDIVTVLNMCDFLAGHDIWCRDVRDAMRDVLGRPPDRTFSDTSWIVRSARDPGFSVNAGLCCNLADVVAGCVDKIVCLTCPQGIDRRVAGLMSEFGGLGLADMVMLFPNAHNVFAHAELDRRRFANDGAKAINVKNCTLGHYCMVKFALDAGWKRVMFVEDDCRFVRPLPMLEQYLRAMPADCNAVLDFAGFPRTTFLDMFELGTWNRWGVIPKGTSFDNFACYILGRDGMECLVEHFERCGTDGYRWPVDACDRVWPQLTQSVEVYIPRLRLARQDGGASLTRGMPV